MSFLHIEMQVKANSKKNNDNNQHSREFEFCYFFCNFYFHDLSNFSSLYSYTITARSKTIHGTHRNIFFTCNNANISKCSQGKKQ